LKTGSLLIIEDDLDDQELLKEVLIRLDFRNTVHFFENGQRALEFLINEPGQPFLILCDINLPVMNGLELRTAIDKDPFLKQKSIPFVFFSTTDEKRYVEAAYELTVQGYFRKASGFASLIKQLQVIIEYWSLCKHPNS
jgi:CheY-like chemotaxis protein